MSPPRERPDHFSDPQSPLLSQYAGDRDMAELIDFFISELRDRIGLLAEAWRENDEEQLRRIAHQLKGAAGGYGFPAITERAAALEHALLDDGTDAEAVCRRLEALIDVCRRAACPQ